MALVATSLPPHPIDRSISTSSASMFAQGRPPPSPAYSSPRSGLLHSPTVTKEKTSNARDDARDTTLPVTPTSSILATASRRPSEKSASDVFTIMQDKARGDASAAASSGSAIRPAKDVDAFNSLLPPPVEFVEGSSSGSFMQTLEGKYEAINGSPRAVPRQLENGNTKAKSIQRQEVDEPAKPAPKISLYTASIDLSWQRNWKHGSGLINTGNTCFLNSALQCLLHTPPLLRILSAHPSECRSKGMFCMPCAMRHTMCDSYTKGRAFVPSQITRNLSHIGRHLKKGRQEDTHEFLRYAIDAMQKSCLAGHPPKMDPKIAETTWVHKLFGGRLRSRVSCQACGHNSDTYDRVLDLSLDIYNMPGLKDALRKFTAVDHLRGADKYKCEKCKRPVNAEKRFTIHEAPPILTVHLKRFTPLGRKLQHPVRYDERLSLQPYMSEGQYGPTYTLYGVISHMGGGPNHGHYFAHVRGGDGQWYEMNDDSVERARRPEPLNMKSAYVLFYMRERGQALEAAVNGYASANGAAKKRKVVDDSDVDMESLKETSSPKSFIGPVIPSHLRVSVGNPQQETLRKKIDAAEQAKSKSVVRVQDANSRVMKPFADYGVESDDDKGERIDRSDLPTSNGATVATSTSSSPTSESVLTPDDPSVRPPPTSSPPMTSPVKPIEPASFYGTSSKTNKNKRKSPELNDDDNDEESIANTSSISSSGMRLYKPSPSRGAIPNTTKRYSQGNSNPFGRKRISDNLRTEKDENRELFRPRNPVKHKYKRRPGL